MHNEERRITKLQQSLRISNSRMRHYGLIGARAQRRLTTYTILTWCAMRDDYKNSNNAQNPEVFKIGSVTAIRLLSRPANLYCQHST